MDIGKITLSKLAIAGVMFNSLMPFNASLQRLFTSTNNRIDLNNEFHRQCLIQWLNDWGCRHLSKEQHKNISNSIFYWFGNYGSQLIVEKKPVWELSESEIGSAARIYGMLKDEVVTTRIHRGTEQILHIGPTAASKILFALRPEAIMPWDEAMRKDFTEGPFDGGPKSYLKYLLEIRQIAYHVDRLCQSKGFSIAELSGKIGRQGSTFLCLLNEYIWITVTRKVGIPSADVIKEWAFLD